MKNFLRSKKSKLVIILIIAAIFRLYGINWDQNQHLHPDERFLTMVTQSFTAPKNLWSYLDPKKSSFNPYNTGFNFFVYGSLPLTINKITSSIIKIDNFDYNNTTGIIAAFLYSVSVLPIQLSHFFAVDTFLNFFIVLSFYFLILLISTKSIFNSIFIGFTLGLALACKISSVLFIPVIGMGLLFYLLKYKNFQKFLLAGILIVISFYVSSRIADPGIFKNNNFLNPTPNPLFIANLKQLKSFDNPDEFFPPGIQWIKTKAIIFPLKNMILWGFGTPLGILVIPGVIYSAFILVKYFKPSNRLTDRLPAGQVQQYGGLLILFWTLFLFIYQGVQFAKSMRYFLPIYPFLAIMTANFLLKCFETLKQRFGKNIVSLIYCFVVILILVWPFSFISIYSKAHSRVTASNRIYKNFPPGSIISCEYWDDCLPLPLGQKNYTYYHTETLTLFDPDTPQKWQKINNQLAELDYLIMSSNRLWGSIPKVPGKYPITTKFYNDLFAGKLRFTKVAEFTSYPTIPILNIRIPDDIADESFTVYDHPKVLIFQRSQK